MTESRADNALIGDRIVVTGMAGAGKSTFSRRLGTETGLPVIHLDLHSWKPGWVRVPKPEMLQKQHRLLAGEQWIVDSNDVDDALLHARADTLVVMATPWWLCALRALRRGLRRPAETVLPAGCEESLGQRLRDEWGIAWRNWRNRDLVARRYRHLVSDCPSDMQVHVIGRPQDMSAFLERLGGADSQRG